MRRENKIEYARLEWDKMKMEKSENEKERVASKRWLQKGANGRKRGREREKRMKWTIEQQQQQHKKRTE